MKCLYFLSPSLSCTQDVSDDLHQVGVSDFYLHVISRDESGLKKQHIHSSNYLETLDVVRDGFIGAALGFIVGLIGIGLLMYFRPFGADVQVPTFVYVILVGAATLFGAWEGGLTGIATENKKLTRFHDDIAGGKYLVLVYVRKHQEEVVRRMMKERHPDAELVAVDSHFINPFSKVARVAEPAQAQPQVKSTTV
ncbi:hypothetical protein HNQ60_001979 [Povalibacter uvarum]|uniref:DUF1269 domain-containing protein n=1 Tax=Povalibacter uvarum TaxID=732238 RepID=A0A841HIS7_9GAMM|nr:hypothetical protein [Povalibacter uvarum]MBB6093101.1 hypothetical protein [Povalibacter uvarum]